MRAELVERLRRAGYDLDPAEWQEREDLVTGNVQQTGKRRLMLTSWEALLDRLAQRTEKDGDRQACFELAELRGLANDAIRDDDPCNEKIQLKQLISDADTRA